MQVTPVPPTPGIAASGPQPVAAGPKPTARSAASAAGEVAVRSFERALVEAAGLSPQNAARFRVALSVDENSNRVIAKMYNKETGELVRQIPTDQMLRNAALIREMLGAAVDAVA